MAASSRGSPLRERGLRTSSASVRPPMPGFANPPPPNLDLPRFRRRPSRRLRAAVFPGPIGPFELGGAEAAERRCVPALLRIASMRPNGSGAASSRAGRARASAPASRCSCATGARFPSGRLNGAGESGRTRKGRRPAPTPLNETRFLSYKPFPSYGPGSKRGARRLRRAPRVSVVEPRGIEPLTSWLPAMRSPS